MQVAGRRLDALLLDLDGVLLRGRRPIPGAAEFVERLETSGVPWLVLTNNSTRSPADVAAVLHAAGIPARPENIMTSAGVAAAWLRDHGGGGRVLVVGESGLLEALEHAGIPRTEDPEQAAHVLVGLDRGLTYEKLARASLAIGRGATFLGTNADRSYPSERGLEPGAGALLALLTATTGVEPRTFGKPEPAMFENALQRLGSDPNRTAMVGDRPETDIVGAAHYGLVTIAVCTGATPASAWAACRPAPDVVVDSVAALVPAVRDATPRPER